MSGITIKPYSGSKFVLYKLITSAISFEAAFTPAPGSHPYTNVRLFEFETVVEALPPSR
jgi:hypothetical protein